MTEKQIESLICTWLNYQPGVFAFKVNTTGVYDPIRKIFRKNKNKHLRLGTADLICAINIEGIPIFAAFEIKVPKGKQSQNQREFEIACKKANGYYFILRSIEDAEMALKDIYEEVKKKII